MEEKDVKITVDTQETVNSKENITSTSMDADFQEESFADTAAEVNELQKLQQEAGEWKDKYIRLVAEFDNFRKRNAKERIELIQTAGKDVIVALLDVVDDCERAQKQIETADDLNTNKEGIMLVFNKLKTTLQTRGLKAMESVSQDFNPDIHEAITEVPTVDETLKGKVIDEVQKGYYLNDKIIRFAKVVVGK